MFNRFDFRRILTVGTALLVLTICGCGGSSILKADAAQLRSVSYVTGTVALTAPNSGERVTGPFASAVNSSLSYYCYQPYVEYWLWDGGSYNQRLGTSTTAPYFPVTLTPPAGKFAYYRLTAKLYARDSSGPPYGPFLLDTDAVNIVVDTD
jgi:hypothetical protein